MFCKSSLLGFVLSLHVCVSDDCYLRGDHHKEKGEDRGEGDEKRTSFILYDLRRQIRKLVQDHRDDACVHTTLTYILVYPYLREEKIAAGRPVNPDLIHERAKKRRQK